MKPVVNRVVRLGAALLVLLMAGEASAHHLWLEQEGGTARLYFGEFAENLREASPGSLDRLQPQARAIGPGAGRALTLEKAANGFAVAGTVGPADAIVAEDTRFPVFTRKDGGRSIYWPAARLAAEGASPAPTLTLDLVPAGEDRYRVVFKGQPLAKAKVEILTPFGWRREVHSGEDGHLRIALPWRGTYVLEVHHDDKTPGKRGDDAYDVMNYVTSLTMSRKQGLEPPLSLPAAQPHK